MPVDVRRIFDLESAAQCLIGSEQVSVMSLRGDISPGLSAVRPLRPCGCFSEMAQTLYSRREGDRPWEQSPELPLVMICDCETLTGLDEVVALLPPEPAPVVSQGVV